MNNEWKMVPVEPTKEQTLAVCMHPDLARALYRSMVSAAPMPPAGDVEVLGWALNDGDEHPIDITLQWGIAKHWPEYATPLVDRAHVTRLTAERDGLTKKIEALRSILRMARVSRDDALLDKSELQSELTKARELIATLEARVVMKDAGIDFRDALISEAQEIAYHELSCTWLSRASTLFPHQSAPAAKGGE